MRVWNARCTVRSQAMPTPPTTYDDITRRTVPEPDSSWRPSAEQERRAYEGARAMDADEQALWTRVHDTLFAERLDDGRVQVEVDGDLVTLAGEVEDTAALQQIVYRVSEIPGVGSVIDQLVIAPRG